MLKSKILPACIAFAAVVGHAQTVWTPHAGNPVMLKALDPTANSIYAPSVVLHKGKYHCYYTRKVSSKAENIGHAVSDDGLSWSAVDSVSLGLSTDATRFDSKQVGQAALISEGDTLKMWYWASGPHGGNIGLAWTLDGKAWTRVDGPATDKSVYDITMDGASSPAIACPNVIKDGGTYKMWYSRVKVVGLSVTYVIAHATSPDGLVWTKAPGSGAAGAVVETGATEKFDAVMAFFSSVIKDGATYRMWYSGSDAAGKIQIGYATSTDGIAWTKVDGTLAKGGMIAGATGSVMKSGEGYKIWYMGETGMDYATSGLPVRVLDRSHSGDGASARSGVRFDSRGKRLDASARRFPGLHFKQP